MRRGSGWRWFRTARRAGSVEWQEVTAPAEAIRRAILLPARKPPEWLREAAARAGAELLAQEQPEADSATPEIP